MIRLTFIFAAVVYACMMAFGSPVLDGLTMAVGIPVAWRATIHHMRRITQ